MNKLAAITLGACLIGSVAPVLADNQTSMNLAAPELGAQFDVLGHVNQPIVSLTDEQLSAIQGEQYPFPLLTFLGDIGTCFGGGSVACYGAAFDSFLGNLQIVFAGL